MTLNVIVRTNLKNEKQLKKQFFLVLSHLRPYMERLGSVWSPVLVSLVASKLIFSYSDCAIVHFQQANLQHAHTKA